MPKALEKKVRACAKKKHPDFSKKEEDAYVFSVLRKTGWKPSHQKEVRNIIEQELKRQNWTPQPLCYTFFRTTYPETEEEEIEIEEEIRQIIKEEILREGLKDWLKSGF